MGYYIGIDVACKESVLSVVDETGVEKLRGRCKTSGDAIHTWIRKRRLTVVAIAIETGVECHHLAHSLSSSGYTIEIVDARKCAKLMGAFHKNKNDPNDAFALAQLLRTNLCHSVHPKESAQLEKVSLCSARRQLVETRVRLANCIRSLLKVHGIKRQGSFNTEKWREMVAGEQSISAMLKATMLPLLDALQSVELQIGRLDSLLEESVESSEEAQLLITAPGVGPIVAFTFLAYIQPDERFSRSRNVGAFIGMTPREHSSGQRTWRGKVSKCGPSELRAMLMQAGMSVLTSTKKDSQLRQWGLRLAEKKGKRHAAMAVGRKLAIIMYRMLVKGEAFKPCPEERRVTIAA
jgi:transposase